MLARGALEGEHRRAVYLVNRKGGEILGRTAYRSLGELPEAAELVVVTVPADGFELAVDEALEAAAPAGVRSKPGLGVGGPGAEARAGARVSDVRAPAV